jgi:hypothetical protein
MIVTRHCETALVSLGPRLPVSASAILARLRADPAPRSSLALEVCRLQYAIGEPDSSNGNSVIVIIRDGMAVTAMLRREWSQPFTPRALRVDAVRSWEGRL